MNRLLLAATLLAAAAVPAAAPAHAQSTRESNLSGKKLVEYCASKERVMQEACTAYIDGIADASAFYQRILPSDGTKGGKLPAYYCVPATTTGTQMRQTVVDWLKSHPDQADKRANSVVLRALNDTYLCPGEKPRQAQ